MAKTVSYTSSAEDVSIDLEEDVDEQGETERQVCVYLTPDEDEEVEQVVIAEDLDELDEFIELLQQARADWADWEAGKKVEGEYDPEAPPETQPAGDA